MPHEWVNYKALRAELSFIEILHHYGVELRERGEQWQGFCPLPTHEGKRNSPSFSANVGRGIWQCFGCGAKGNVIEFATRMEGLNPDDQDDFRKAALLLQKMFVGKDGEEREIPRPGPKVARRERSEQEDLEEELSGVVNAPLDFELQRLDYSHPYLRERGFSEETVKTFGLGYCERGLMKGRIAIPLHNAKGALIGYAGRIVDEDAIGENTPRYLFPGSRERNGTRHVFRKSAFLYNGFRVGKASRLMVVVESFTAVWWLTQAGIPNVVALMGASCSETQGELLRDLVPEDRSIWIFPDGDKAGARMAEEALVMLAPHRFVRLVTLEEGKQPTDLSSEELRRRLGLP